MCRQLTIWKWEVTQIPSCFPPNHDPSSTSLPLSTSTLLVPAPAWITASFLVGLLTIYQLVWLTERVRHCKVMNDLCDVQYSSSYRTDRRFQTRIEVVVGKRLVK